MVLEDKNPGSDEPDQNRGKKVAVCHEDIGKRLWGTMCPALDGDCFPPAIFSPLFFFGPHLSDPSPPSPKPRCSALRYPSLITFKHYTLFSFDRPYGTSSSSATLCHYFNRMVREDSWSGYQWGFFSGLEFNTTPATASCGRIPWDE